MKNIILVLFSILFNLVVAISNDCIKLNTFLMIDITECCGSGIAKQCDNEGFITEIQM